MSGPLGWLPLLIILALATWIRVPMLGAGYSTTDLVTFESWTRSAVRQGLFAVYANAQTPVVDHPPIGVTLLTAGAKVYEMTGGNLDQDSAGFRAALKIPLLILDLALIAAGYIIARHEARSAQREGGVAWATIVAAVLAFTPGLIADSVWWGQTDNLFSLCLVLTIYALHRRRRTATWVMYGLTILVKFQGIALLPLLAVLTWRRFGLAGIVRGAAVMAVVVVVGLAPFVLASGNSALRPYSEGVGKYPFVSINAHNFWYWSLAWEYDLRTFGQPTDTALTVGPLPVRTVGFILFGFAAALVAWRAWLHPDRRDEFLLATGLYVAFFMFSTQMHERYLYPAVALMALAMVGSRWLWLLCLGFAVTVSQNILDPASRDTPLWEGTWRVIGWSNFQNARLNVLLTAALFGAILAPLYRLTRLPVPGARFWRTVAVVVVAALLVAEAGLRVGFAQLPVWMQDTLRDVRITPFTGWRLSTTALWQPDAQYGASVQPGLSNAQFRLPGATIRVTTASLPGSRIGIRDDQPIIVPVDAVAVGGGDTFCLTETTDCWVNSLASEHGLKIVNLGQPETGSVAHLALLRDSGKQLQPRMVLWLWSVYDVQADYQLALAQGRTGNLTPDANEGRAACNPTLPEYSAVYALVCAVDRWPPLRVTARVEYGKVAMNVSSVLAPLAADRPDMAFGLDQTAQALDAANQMAKTDLHAALIVLIVPTKEEVYSNRASPPLDAGALDKLSQSRLRLVQTCQDRGWSCLDLYPVLRSQADHAEQMYDADLPYLNPAGNRVVAQGVAEMLAGQGLIK